MSAGTIDALRRALEDAIESLEYVNRNHPEVTGSGVREERISAGRAALGAYSERPAPRPGRRLSIGPLEPAKLARRIENAGPCRICHVGAGEECVGLETGNPLGTAVHGYGGRWES